MLKVAGGGGGVPDPLVLENDATFNDVSIGHGTGDDASNVVVGENVMPQNVGTNQTLVLYGKNVLENRDGKSTYQVLIGEDVLTKPSTSGINYSTYVNFVGTNIANNANGADLNECIGIGWNLYNFTSALGAVCYSCCYIGGNGGNLYGNNNVGIGSYVFTNESNTYQNTAVGSNACRLITNRDNVGVGYYALGKVGAGYENVGIGSFSAFGGASTNGPSNRSVFIGFEAGFESQNNQLNTVVGWKSARQMTSGVGNVCVGSQAGYNLTTGQNNVFVGNSAGYLYQTTNRFNTFVGASAGYNNNNDSNTCIGYGAGSNYSTGTYNVNIGRSAQPPNSTSSGQFTLGDTNIVNLRCNDTTISSLSDARDKTEIIDCPFGLSFLMSLQPRQFKWQTRDGNAKDGLRRTGFIAQELLEACDGQNDILNLVGEENPDKYEAKAGNLIPILVKAIQELKAEVDALKQQLA